MLTIEEKIDFIKKQSEKHEISAYEFWKITIILRGFYVIYLIIQPLIQPFFS